MYERTEYFCGFRRNILNPNVSKKNFLLPSQLNPSLITDRVGVGSIYECQSLDVYSYISTRIRNGKYYKYDPSKLTLTYFYLFEVDRCQSVFKTLKYKHIEQQRYTSNKFNYEG